MLVAIFSVVVYGVRSASKSASEILSTFNPNRLAFEVRKTLKRSRSARRSAAEHEERILAKLMWLAASGHDIAAKRQMRAGRIVKSPRLVEPPYIALR